MKELRFLIAALPLIAWGYLVFPAWEAEKKHYQSALSEHRRLKTDYANYLDRISPTVYITAHGYAYHRKYHYQNRTDPVELHEVYGIYTPCEVCKPPSSIHIDKLPPSPPVQPDDQFEIFTGFLAIGLAIILWQVTPVCERAFRKASDPKSPTSG